MIKKFIQLVFITSSVFSSVVVHAHHSFAATFKADSIIDVDGTVTRYNFKNPHVLIYFDVTNDDGSVTNWVAEGVAATNLRRTGWDKQTVTVGDNIRITGNETRDGSPMVSMESIAFLNKDGSVISEQNTEEGDGTAYDKDAIKVSMPTKLADGKPNLTGTWTTDGSPYDSPRAPFVPLSDVGLAALAAFDLADDPQVFCDAPGYTRQTGMTPHPVRITQYDDRVVFEYEEYGGRHVAYFDKEKANSGIKTHLGDSYAYYKDDALVVETTNLLSNLATAEGKWLSDQATVVQTYRRVDEEEAGPLVEIKTITSDPINLAEDFILVNTKMAAGDYEFIENDCEPPLRERTLVSPAMNFFLTSEGPGNGADLGGLAGADQHCKQLAGNVGQGDKNWRAYLSTTSVNARDRIGQGPWYNAKGEVVATSLENLHSDENMLTKASVVTERGQVINGRGDTPNRHDILTGSQINGMASLDSGTDTTCANWTSSGEGSALVGHFDRVGGGANPTSWNNAHASKGCSQENLQETGGDGLFYCFAIED
jgi:hypothetical protein